MEVIQEHRDLDAGHAEPGVMLDAHLETWIGLKCYLDGTERCNFRDLVGAETSSG